MRVSEQIPFDLQVRVWGAAWDGEDLAEVTAMLCERGDAPMHPWDRDDEYLSSGVLITDEGVTRLPDRYALPLVADYLIRTSDDNESED